MVHHDIDAAIESAADRAAPIFRHFGWTYFGEDTPPTKLRLENTIRRLVEGIQESATVVRVSGGRFTVSRSMGEDDEYKDGGGRFDIRLDLATFVPPIGPQDANREPTGSPESAP